MPVVGHSVGQIETVFSAVIKELPHILPHKTEEN